MFCCLLYCSMWLNTCNIFMSFAASSPLLPSFTTYHLLLFTDDLLREVTLCIHSLGRAMDKVQGEVRWGEVRWGEVRWGWGWGEVRWGEGEGSTQLTSSADAHEEIEICWIRIYMHHLLLLLLLFFHLPSSISFPSALVFIEFCKDEEGSSIKESTPSIEVRILSLPRGPLSYDSFSYISFTNTNR